MNQAFYAGISGLQTHQFGIDILADNLSNLNTVGFRGSRTEFASLFETSVAQADGLSNTVGMGARVQATMMETNGGSLYSSDNNSDLAIEGNGWFGIMGHEDPFYTRAGNFTFDANADLVTQGGYRVLGTVGNNIQGNTLTQQILDLPLGDVNQQVELRFPSELNFPVQPTTLAEFSGNLGPSDGPVKMSAWLVSPNNESNRLTLTFTKNPTPPAVGSSQWDIVATVTDSNGLVTYDTQTGTATFSDTGSIIGFNIPNVNSDGASVAIDLGQNYDGVTAMPSFDFSSASSTDGILAGFLTGYRIDQGANIVASFSNGQSSAVGKIGIFHFKNEQGLDRLSGTRFTESANSGEKYFFQDPDGNNILGANLWTNKLETSNISMEVSMTEMIIMQRAYGANAKSITTGDELIQKALQMDA